MATILNRASAVGLSIALAASIVFPASVTDGHSTSLTTELQPSAQGAGGFSPTVGRRPDVNVRALAARGSTSAPTSVTLPFLTLPTSTQPSPAVPTPRVYTGTTPVEATVTANPAAAQPGFAGLARASNPPATSVEPPDPWVAVGPDHVVQAVNRALRFTDRSGGSSTVVTLGDFLLTSGLSVTTYNADPRVIYDAYHGRWVATELSWDCDATDPLADFGHGYVDVRISDTSDPTGDWSGFFIGYNDALPDYPAMGTSTDKVAFSSNIFLLDGSADCIDPFGFAGTDSLVLDWSAILNITTLPFNEYYTSYDYFTPRWAVQTPATSGDLRMVIQKDLSGGAFTGPLDVAYKRISGAVGAGGVFAELLPTDLTAANVVQDFLDPIDPRQPGAGAWLQGAIDSRPTDAIWQNNTLTFVSTQAFQPAGDTEDRDCVRVTQLDTTPVTPTLAQDFLLCEVGRDSYMGGIGMSLNGGLFVVWTRSSATAGDYPSSYGAYQLPTDAANSISPAELLADGEADYPHDRWGDYVGVAFDPSERNAVWQANQYASSDGWWATRVSQLKTPVEDATYVPLTPARLLDTRFGTGLSGRFFAFTPRTFQVGGLGGVPADAVAVTGNLTVTEQTHLGYISLGPDPVVMPTTSTLNFPVGDNRANGVTVALSLTGTLSATYGAVGGASTHLLFDVTGYFAD